MAEGRAGRGGHRARRPGPRTGPRVGAGCGRVLGGHSGREAGRAPGASPPRPASSPYHVAPPHVEEVSVHHCAVAAALLGHAEQLGVRHPRRRWVQPLCAMQPPAHGAAFPPARLLHARTERVEGRDWWEGGTSAAAPCRSPPGKPSLGRRRQLGMLEV